MLATGPFGDMSLEVSVLTRIRDQCIQARCTVGGSTPTVYYRGCPILQHQGPKVVDIEAMVD